MKYRTVPNPTGPDTQEVWLPFVDENGKPLEHGKWIPVPEPKRQEDDREIL